MPQGLPAMSQFCFNTLIDNQSTPFAPMVLAGQRRTMAYRAQVSAILKPTVSMPTKEASCHS